MKTIYLVEGGVHYEGNTPFKAFSNLTAAQEFRDKIKAEKESLRWSSGYRVYDFFCITELEYVEERAE